MSYIFDALQRSEAERAGGALAEGTVTDLLERVEQHVTEQWSAETYVNSLSASDLPQLDLPFAQKESPVNPQPTQIPMEADGVRAEEEARVFSQIQTLALAPIQQNGLVSITDEESPAAEAFRLLAVRLRRIRKSRNLKRVLITSTATQEGKSFSSANLACTLGRSSQEKVLLLEGDLRRPTISRLFGFPEKPGLCECIQGEASPSHFIYKVEGLNLWIAPAGLTRCNPLDVIQSEKLPLWIDNLAPWFEWIIIDTPPILPMADTTAWARVADGILLVAREGVTEKERLQRGIEAVDPNKLIGALLNSSSGTSETDYYYYRADSNTTIAE